MLFNRGACCGCMNQQMAMPMANPCCGCGCVPTCQIECPAEQVMDPPVERIVRRNIIHNIQHVDPVNTRVINNHIFRHSYVPQYSCCEENTCTVEPSCGCNL